ncbi:GNAT family N-acetyltransferase [Vibrio rumoiensis]|uniref:Histone acetyltransferase n=1 Tax=Vibrio rumoiensis 1S-45 TaxID=1188252 RepID=A0A1E5E170_9VIBR|nr:GNAT family N-acetyltransferase [Vibrio rumoiensis]OEF24273.1 histone acetyltransferase [Vibrio rumoiensis 1S-45]
MFVREAEFKDYSKIAQLHTHNWQQAYQGILDDQYLEDRLSVEHQAIWQTRLTQPPLNQGVILLEEGDKLCGFVCLYGNHSFEHGTMIDNLHVADGYRGKGLGKKLMSEAAKWATKHFADVGMYLEVLTKNESAKAFYDSINGIDAGEVTWKAPCGSHIACHTMTWASPSALLDKTD